MDENIETYKNIEIYCEFGFLEKFYNSCPQIVNGKLNPNIKLWYDLDKLLCKHSDILLIDVDEEALRGRIDEKSFLGQALDSLLKKHYDGCGELICKSDEKRNMDVMVSDDNGDKYFDKDRRSTLFLLDRNIEICQTMEEDYGLIFISSHDIYKRLDFLFSTDIQYVDKSIKNWDISDRYKHPCNSITLVDNYLFGQTGCEASIKTLFNSLLPEKLNKKTFEVQIFTEADKKNNSEWSEGRIKRWIKELRDSYDIKVSIETPVKDEDRTHDRYLITNYCLFQCGFGFVLNGHRQEKGTSLSVYPLTYLSQYDSIPTTNVYKIIQSLEEKHEDTKHKDTKTISNTKG
jgi:hypothetical protein